MASHFRFTDIVELPHDKRMGIEVKDSNLQTPLHYAAKFDERNGIWYGNITTMNLLLEKEAVQDSWDTYIIIIITSKMVALSICF